MVICTATRPASSPKAENAGTMQEVQLLELQTPIAGEVRSAYNLVTNLASNTDLGLYQLDLLSTDPE